MEEKINEELSRVEFGSQDDLKKYVSLVQTMVREYEQHLYEADNYGDIEKNKIKQWRHELYRIIQENKDVPENTEASDELEKTVKMVHRQINKIDTNQQVLDKSTLKLMGLNYTSEDIEKALNDGRKMIKENRMQERREVLMIMIAFVIFICICMMILFDKFVSTR